MFELVTVTTSDLASAQRGYAALIGAPPPWPGFELRHADRELPATENLHVAFRAPSIAEVDSRWRAALDAGFADDGAPGPRTEYGDDYYGGFTLDPDGNSAESVIYDAPHPPGRVDHLWIRVRDLDEAKASFGAAADRSAGWRLTRDDSERVRFSSPAGSISLLPGERATRNTTVVLRGAEPVEL